MSFGALLDTSIFIAAESGRRLNRDAIPETVAVSVVTVGELRAGVLRARTAAQRDRRLSTLLAAREAAPVPIDEEVAFAWARLRVELAEAGRRMPTNDAWIAATALAHGVPVVTQDADYDDVPGLVAIRA